MSRRWIRALVTLALFAALATAPAAAWNGGRHRDETRFAPASRTWMMEVVERLWKGLVAIWENEGASADPNGTPNPPGSQPVEPGPNG